METDSDSKKNVEESSTKSTFFIAVHVGAGYHSPLRSQSYMTAMKDACNAAATILSKFTLNFFHSLSPILTSLEKNGSALDAVVAALSSLEDSPITNAGKGSNLTEDGRVECDASVMESQRGAEGTNTHRKNNVSRQQRFFWSGWSRARR
jgi:taspase (threonine aspartase 1)